MKKSKNTLLIAAALTAAAAGLTGCHTPEGNNYGTYGPAPDLTESSVTSTATTTATATATSAETSAAVTEAPDSSERSKPAETSGNARPTEKETSLIAIVYGPPPADTDKTDKPAKTAAPETEPPEDNGLSAGLSEENAENDDDTEAVGEDTEEVSPDEIDNDATEGDDQ